MTIAIDIRAISGKKAGKGWALYYLLEALVKIPKVSAHKFILLTDREAEFKFELPNNFAVQKKNWPGIFWHLAVAWQVRFSKEIDLYFAPTSFIVPALTSRKCVVMVHDLVSKLFPKGHNKKAILIENLFMKKALRKARSIIAISQNTKQDLAKLFPGVEEKTIVVYLAGGPGYKMIEKPKIEVKVPEKFIIFTSTIEPRKNVKRIIQALKEVRKSLDIDLVVVGKKGWQWEGVFREIEKQELEQHVHYLDYISNSNLVKLYNKAQAFVFPSLYEGFGLPVLEAMQCGCPVVTSNSSSLPEVAGEAAVLVDPKDVNSIAKGIEQAIANKADLREKGLNQAAKFSWQKTAKEIYEQLTKQ